MVTIGFSFAIVLVLFQEYVILDSSGLSSSFSDDKVTLNKFHGKIDANPNRKNLNKEAGSVNFKQRNLQKTGSGSNAVSGGSGTRENVESATGRIVKDINEE